MASSLWFEDRYQVHFFCALCGGPFARVHRTDVPPEYKTAAGRSDDDDDDDDDEEEHSSPAKAGCTIPSETDANLTAQELAVNDYGRIDTAMEQGEWHSGRVQDLVDTVFRRAYDGSCIGEQDMAWTKVLRALIHRNAQHHPDGGRQQLQPQHDVYLTGRGRVLEHGPWATAHPSITVDVEEAENGGMLIDFEDQPSRFHMYQEPDRDDRKFQIASIPFHEECWDIFQEALRASLAARRLEPQPGVELVSYNAMWSYWCELMPTAADNRISDPSLHSFTSGAAENPITRFSSACMGASGYREAQPCGAGKRWLHGEGLHWLVANPRMSRLRVNPFRDHFPPPPPPPPSESIPVPSSTRRRMMHDPFRTLPAEVVVETVAYLSCVDTFCWRVASLHVHHVVIPQRAYRRFFVEEMHFLPGLMLQLNEYESAPERAAVDWCGLLRYASRSWRGDIGLRNRRRIWNIVQPMADGLVERSSRHLLALGNVHQSVASEATVARGNVGIRSGLPGHHETVIFSEPFRQISRALESQDVFQAHLAANEPLSPSIVDGDIVPDDLSHALKKVDIWLDPEERHVCGLRFVFLVEHEEDEEPRTRDVPLLLGRRTALSETFVLDADTRVVTGFRVCWARGRLGGIQLVLEDTDREPTEFCEHETYSRRYGRWDGPVRRLVAPRKYRILAGVTLFMSDSGLVETFAIIEKKRPQVYDVRLDVIPDTVALSDRESSLWVTPTPNDVDLLERLGPSVGDWRLRTSHWEVFARTSLHQPPGDITGITLYHDADHLLGLSFEYLNSAGEPVLRELGKCCTRTTVKIPIAVGEEIASAVIGHGRTGVFSLQLATTLGCVAPPCGARYRGSRKVYALTSAMASTPHNWPAMVSFLKNPIIGFHCLYSSKLGRLVQLGVITRTDAIRRPLSSAMMTMGCFQDQLPSPNPDTPWPFIELDDLYRPWVDGAPPRQLTRGRKNSDSMKRLTVGKGGDFAGWVSLRDPISRIVIYGKMEGIRISYSAKTRPDCCFGNTNASVRGKTRFFYNNKAGPIVAVARYGPSPRSSANTHQDDHLPPFKPLDPAQRAAWRGHIEVESQYLAAIGFNFTASRLVDWRPLFDLASQGDDADQIRLQKWQPWKLPAAVNYHPGAEPDRDLTVFQTVLADFFVGSGSVADAGDGFLAEADGVKGYVSTHLTGRMVQGTEEEVILTRFCGLRFRRKGIWDDEPLGKMSAYEHVFLLWPDEKFVSVYYSSSELRTPPTALALSTSLGRTTPWFGYPYDDVAEAVTAPPGRQGVGVYMVYVEPGQCAAVGILHEKEMEPDLAATMSSPHSPSNELLDLNESSELPWVLRLRSWFFDYRFVDRFDDYACESKLGRRAITFVAPNHLRSIEAYVNTLPGRYGLRGLRFCGNPQMGTVLLGEWEDGQSRALPEHRMSIDSAGGERVVELRITFNDLPDGERIIGMVVKTSHGQEKDIVSWRALTDEPPPKANLRLSTTRCAQGEQVVGFSYVIEGCVREINFITALDRL